MYDTCDTNSSVIYPTFYLRELVVPVRYELFVGGERRDNVSQRRQGLVDALGLLQPFRGGPRLVGPLRAREVHQRQLPGGRLLGRFVVHLLLLKSFGSL